MNKHKDIPNNWKWVTLDDIGIVVSGGTPSTKEPEFWGDEIPWITPSDLSKYNKIYISKGRRSISKIGLEYSSAKLIPKNSILFSSRAPIGYVAIAKNELATNQGFKNIIISEFINAKYIYYYLTTIKELAESKASGSTFLELSGSKFKRIPFPIPPIEEQNRIVSRIEELSSELDKSRNDLQLAKKKTSLLIKSFLNNSFTNEKIKFFSKSLSQISELITDGSHFSPKTLDNGFPYITVRDIKDNSIDFTNCKKISETSFNELKKNGCSPSFDDLLFSKDGTVGKVVLNKYEKEFVVLSSIAIITPNKNEILPEYLFYYLKSDLFLNQALDSKKGVAIKRVVLRDLKNLSLNIPSLKDQHKIVEELDEHFINTKRLLKEIDAKIYSNRILYKKILSEAFKGKLSFQLKTDSSVEKSLKNIENIKVKYIEQKLKKKREYKKPRRKIKKIEDILEENFTNVPFSFEELNSKSNLSMDRLKSDLFEMLDKNEKLKMFFDKTTNTIKYIYNEG